MTRLSLAPKREERDPPRLREHSSRLDLGKGALAAPRSPWCGTGARPSSSRARPAAFPEISSCAHGAYTVDTIGYEDDREAGACTGALSNRKTLATSWEHRTTGFCEYGYVADGFAKDSCAALHAGCVSTELSKPSLDRPEVIGKEATSHLELHSR